MEEDTNQKSDITFGRLTINPSSQRVYIDDSEIYLSKKEMELLLYFTQNVDQVLLRDAMITAVWGYDYDGGQRTIDTSIKRLREKLGPLSGYVQTVRGYGYRFTVNDDV